MAAKAKKQRDFKAPKVRSSIPRSEILKAIKEVAAARRGRKQKQASDAVK